MSLSRSAARGVWDEAARNAYSAALQGPGSAARNCVKVSGDQISYSRECFKKAFSSVKGHSGALGSAWGD